MKKVFVFCLTMVLVVSMGVSVFAAPGKFVSSPSGNLAPVLVDYEYSEEGCSGYIKITPYSERDTLDEPTRLQLESAYDQIVNNAAAVSEVFAELAKEENVPVDRLACSDLFDISYYGCEEHKDHDGYFTITFNAETLQNFVGLLHLYDGKWEVVDNAVTGEDGTTLTFQVSNLTPFAIIVDTGSDADAPETGDNSMVHVWVILMVVSALMLVLIAAKNKKAGATR